MTNSENRKDEGLHALGKKTEYRMDYAPEVLETFETNTRKMTIGYSSTALSLPPYALSPDNRTLGKSSSNTFQT